DPAHLQDQVGRRHLAGDGPADLDQQLEVGVGERRLARPGHRVAERAPQVLHLFRPQPGAAGDGLQVVDRRLVDQQPLDGQQRQRPVALGPVELLGRAPGGEQLLAHRPQGTSTLGARAVGAHANVPPSGDGGTAGPTEVSSRGGLTGTGPSSASPWRSVVDHVGSRPGATSRTGPTPGWGSTSHSSATRSPCQRTEYDTRPSAVGASRTSQPWPYQRSGTRLDRAIASTPAGPSTSRTSRTRTKLSSSAAAQPWWPSPMQPPGSRGWTASGHVQVGEATDSSQSS